ncbi:hypothetical protein [Pedobacter frigoris]|uniref:Tetratricopeptide repeat protein n=1 Tax=Pedobacter frigoris TaxID=2571272 RepID=A0A4U1CM88_9SPHI|nr:hypothetical protein [Pedobacter frigoris]TKC07471.1 hypothetical protein FA047_09500 [Pedobacter frigoris]
MFFNVHKDDTETYYKSEQELNDLALELLEDKHEDAALEAPKLCTILYPTSWNVYDSFGIALLQTERKAEALEMYKNP